MNRWVIRRGSQDSDRVDLVRSGRQVRADISAAEAKRYIKAHAIPGDVVSLEDPDGYRTRLSGSSRRRRKR